MSADRQQQRFRALLDAHGGIVLKVASMYARNDADRDDLVQEICIQLWRSFDRYDEARGRFSTWMYRVALNVAISQERRAARHQAPLHPLQPWHLECIGGGTGIDEPDPRLQALYALIDQLDPLNRALILLYLEDRSHAEIAEILGISETNVATKIGRIKQKLRRQVTAAHSIGA